MNCGLLDPPLLAVVSFIFGGNFREKCTRITLALLKVSRMK
jgi:hypothetical protein